MDIPSEQLKKIRKRISETLADAAAKQKELDEVIGMLHGISQSNQDQLSNSGSWARERRTKRAAKQNRIADYERQRIELEQAIGRMWEKIGELQEKEKAAERAMKRT